MKIITAAVFTATVLGRFALAQDSACAAHHASVDAHGDAVMGFDHEKTTHRFALTVHGGVIEVSANDPNDAASREAIRTHLSHISQMFAAGDFDAPMLIHGQVPPGVPVLKEKKAKILWTYEKTASGGRIVIATDDAKALEAIHDFLKFQISDHRTGDSAEVGPDPNAEK